MVLHIFVCLIETKNYSNLILLLNYLLYLRKDSRFIRLLAHLKAGLRYCCVEYNDHQFTLCSGFTQ